MKSIWNMEKPEFKMLEEDIQTDVLIIGGGLAGLLCAYKLKKAGVDCILLEANKILSGITKNTTAKITYQHGLIYSEIISRYGEDTARLYLEAQRKSIEEYKKLAKNIDCDFKICDFFVYSLNNRHKIEEELKALRKIGCPAEFSDALPLPFEVAGAVKTEGQAMFHPLKFAYSIARDLPIYESTKVVELMPGCAITNHGKVRADKIIIASHFPFINKHGSYFLKMYQHRSYVVALKNAQVLEDMYIDESESGMSFRSYKDLLLVGGGSHRTGKNGGGWKELEDFARTVYPEASEVCRWATQDCMTLDKMPYIGMYSKKTPSLYVATGFNKWGMTSSMTAAEILTDRILGKENKYTELFSPDRTMLHPQLFTNITEAVKGVLSPTVPRCPHMGCALKYNPAEHTWDCSCHGSRFSETGEIIDNPSTDDIKIKKSQKFMKTDFFKTICDKINEDNMEHIKEKRTKKE